MILDIKKQTQELYSLINFGELRKKISLSHKKHYEKLSEMIYSGATQLKIRGKARKVRTPLCRALRKLNHIQGKFLLVVQLLCTRQCISTDSQAEFELQ